MHSSDASWQQPQMPSEPQDAGSDAGEDGGIDQDLIGINNRIHLLRGHTDEVTCVAFSGDGKLAATGSSDHTAKLWDVSSGVELHTLRGHTGEVVAVEFTLDGEQVMTASADGSVKMWRVADGVEVRSMVDPDNPLPAIHAALATKAPFVAVAHGSHVNLWDIATGQRLWSAAWAAERVGFVDNRVQAYGNGWLTQFTLDGMLWTRSEQTVLIQYKHEGGSYLRFEPPGMPENWEISGPSAFIEHGTFDGYSGHTDEVREVFMSADEQIVLTCSDDHTAKIWVDPDDSVYKRLPLRTFEHRGPVKAVALSRDTELVLTGSADMTAALWWRARGTLVRYLRPSREARFFPDGLHALLASSGDVWRIDLVTGEPMAYRAHQGVRAVAITKDEKVVAGCENGDVRLLNGTTLDVEETLTGHAGEVRAVALGPGNTALTGSADGTARLWDLATGALVRTIDAHRDGVVSVAFSSDGTKVLTAGQDDQVTAASAKVWDAKSGELVRTLIGGGTWAAVFTLDGTGVITADSDGKARVWSIASGQVVRSFGDGDTMLHAVLAPDGKMLITSDLNGWVLAWNIETGEPMLYAGRRLHQALWELSAIDMAPDGKRLLLAMEANRTDLLDIRPLWEK